MIKYWGPWLDPTHPRPAKPGELRWFAVVDGRDVEVAGPGEHARSRTFIPARLEDNPDLFATGYAAVLEGMPEPLRTMLREGRFDVGQSDAEFQVIPTAWIVAAQERWKPDGFRDFAMTAMGFDPAGGGEDSAALAFRHGGWYAPLVTEKGAATADANAAAATIFRHRRDNAPIVVDVGGGYGGAVTLRLRDNGVWHTGFNGANASAHKTLDRQLGFTNKGRRPGGGFARRSIPSSRAARRSVCRPIRNCAPISPRRPTASARAALSLNRRISCAGGSAVRPARATPPSCACRKAMPRSANCCSDPGRSKASPIWDMRR